MFSCVVRLWNLFLSWQCSHGRERRRLRRVSTIVDVKRLYRRVRVLFFAEYLFLFPRNNLKFCLGVLFTQRTDICRAEGPLHTKSNILPIRESDSKYLIYEIYEERGTKTWESQMQVYFNVLWRSALNSLNNSNFS